MTDGEFIDRLIVKRFPRDLHRRLRVASAESGDDMREIVIRALEYHLIGIDPAADCPVCGWPNGDGHPGVEALREHIRAEHGIPHDSALPPEQLVVREVSPSLIETATDLPYRAGGAEPGE